MTLSGLDGAKFDVVVVGAGAVGCSSAQHLACEGYSVLLVDQGDFASGSTSWSSRVIQCGLTFLAQGDPSGELAKSATWDALTHPRRLIRGIADARKAMHCRTQFVRESKLRTRPYDTYFPIFEGNPYKPWEVGIAISLLSKFGSRDVPLAEERLEGAAARDMPFFPFMAEEMQDKLRTVFKFVEYNFDGPERLSVDAALYAEEAGATIRNYARVVGLTAPKNRDDNWAVELQDALDATAGATVQARFLVNSAGVWANKINQMANPNIPDVTQGFKGTSILVRLPDELRDKSLECISPAGQAAYILPMHEYHYLGPYLTPATGDANDARVEGEIVDTLLAEANEMFPRFKLTRKDIRATWCGVTMRSADPKVGSTLRAGAITDLKDYGLERGVSVTEMQVMVHRHAGAKVRDIVTQNFKPGGKSSRIRFEPRTEVKTMGYPVPDREFSTEELQSIVQREHVVTLSDLLLRRVRWGWPAVVPVAEAEKIAKSLGWPDERVRAELAQYRRFIEERYLKEVDDPNPILGDRCT